MVAGCLGHIDHKMIEFLILEEVRMRVQQNCKLGLLEGSHWLV